MPKLRVVLIAAVALLLVAAGIKIGTATKPETPRSEGSMPVSAALAEEAAAAAKKQAEEDAKFWAQKERVSSHVTIEHTQKEEEAARRQQKSLLNTVRAAEATPETNRR